MLWLFEHIEELSYEAMMNLLPLISTERRAKVLRLLDRSAQIQSISAELLLRYAIWREYGVRKLPAVDCDENKKPYFPGKPEICFNLSHCKTAAACAIDTLPVGVDVQEIGCLREMRPHADSQDGQFCTDRALAEQSEANEVFQSLLWVLHADECAWVLSGLSPTERERRFITIWTFKEAYGKASGVGILYPLERYNFVPCVEGGTHDGVHFQTFFRKDSVMTLCAQSSLPLQTVSPHELIAAVL